MTMVFVCTLMTTVFVCTLITIVFVCMIINYCFGRVIYIKMCIIANAEIFFYFTPGIHFLSVGKLLETTGIPAKPAGKPE